MKSSKWIRTKSALQISKLWKHIGNIQNCGYQAKFESYIPKMSQQNHGNIQRLEAKQKIKSDANYQNFYPIYIYIYPKIIIDCKKRTSKKYQKISTQIIPIQSPEPLAIGIRSKRGCASLNQRRLDIRREEEQLEATQRSNRIIVETKPPFSEP